MFAHVKAELREVLLAAGITQFTIAPVKRKYAFEMENVSHGWQWVLKVGANGVRGGGVGRSTWVRCGVRERCQENEQEQVRWRLGKKEATTD